MSGEINLQDDCKQSDRFTPWHIYFLFYDIFFELFIWGLILLNNLDFVTFENVLEFVKFLVKIEILCLLLKKKHFISHITVKIKFAKYQMRLHVLFMHTILWTPLTLNPLLRYQMWNWPKMMPGYFSLMKTCLNMINI